MLGSVTRCERLGTSFERHEVDFQTQDVGSIWAGGGLGFRRQAVGEHKLEDDDYQKGLGV